MDVISKLPGCAGQAAHAVHPGQNGRCINVDKKSKGRLSRHMDPSTKTQMAWMEDPVVPLERNLYGHPVAGLLWERQFEKVLLTYGWEKVPFRECFFVDREKGLF